MGFHMLVGGAAALAICSTTLAGMSTVTAEFLPPDGYNLGGAVGNIFPPSGANNVHFGQTFTALTTGTLESVTLRIFRSEGIDKNMQVEVYTLDGSGQPDVQLGLSEATPADVPSGAEDFHTFDFDTNAVIQSGTQYAIVIGVEVGQMIGEPRWGLVGFADDVYAGGSFLQSNVGDENFFAFTTRDWGFSVVVPAPGTVALAGVAGLAGLRRRR